jgi:ParB-like chromosome segregation protein Spo0J
MKFSFELVPIPQISGNNLARSKRSPEHQLRLNESVAKFGVLQPGLARKKADTYELFAGFGRLEASKAAGHDKFPLHVYEGDLHQHDILVLACHENNVRESMSLMDQMDTLETITKGKKITDTAAGKLLGLKQSVTSKILSAKARIAEDVLLALSAAGYGYSFAYPLSKVSHEEQRAIAPRLIAEKWSRARLEQELKPEAKRTVQFKGDVTVAISYPKGATYEAILEAIVDSARQLKARQRQELPLNLLPQVFK